jgi:gamma-glutamyltranspeptidase/glutathione hydrolase
MSPPCVRALTLALGLSLASSGAARAEAPPPKPAPKAPFRAARAAVASDHPLASAAGVAVLKAGGNAFDAACATALALGVLHPDASGIGGGGFAVAYVAKQKKVVALDFRERAPAALTGARFLEGGKIGGKVVPELSQQGGLAVGVPGEVRGLGELVKKWGAKPWKVCVDPAQKLAAKGVPVSWRLAKSWETLTSGAAAADPVFAKMFTGKPAEGSTFARPELAATLATLEKDGPDAFYKGPIADEIVKAVTGAGGVLTAQDLESYATTERTPLRADFRGLQVYTMPPPSSGGVALVEALGILAARYPKPADLPKDGRQSPAYLHTVTEAFKNAFADRARFLGDPDFVPVDVARLTAPEYLVELAKRMKADGVLPSDAYGSLGAPPKAPPKDGGTTHLCVVDAAGNAVALTTTINLSFGAKLVAGPTGILLNDQMDDFVMQVGVPNAFGLIGNEQNAVAGKKRPLSSMTPTLALDNKAKNKVKLVIGGAGGPNIITGTTEALLNVVDWKMDAQAAVAAPRIHHQWFPDTLGVEPGVPKETVEALAKLGQKPKDVPQVGKVNLIVRTKKGLEAAAEPRSPSGPAGY